MIFDSELFTKTLKGVLLNCHPLSDSNTLGILNLHTILFQTKFLTFCCVIFAKGSVSTHLAKKSILTTKNFIYLFPSGKGPKISSLYCAKGHGAIIEVRYSDGCLGTLLKH